MPCEDVRLLPNAPRCLGSHPTGTGGTGNTETEQRFNSDGKGKKILSLGLKLTFLRIDPPTWHLDSGNSQEPLGEQLALAWLDIKRFSLSLYHLGGMQQYGTPVDMLRGFIDSTEAMAEASIGVFRPPGESLLLLHVCAMSVCSAYCGLDDYTTAALSVP